MKNIVLLALAGGMLCAATDPCQFLSQAEVDQFLPGAKPGRLDRSKEKLSLVSCHWETPVASVAVSFSPEPTNETPEQEARGFIDGFVDPLNPKAREAVRVETLAIPGGQGAAVVEAVDRAKGIVTNIAYVTVRGKQHQATIFTSGRVDDRAAKLKALAALARAAAARM